jgi:hypothetical protein
MGKLLPKYKAKRGKSTLEVAKVAKVAIKKPISLDKMLFFHQEHGVEQEASVERQIAHRFDQIDLVFDLV